MSIKVRTGINDHIFDMGELSKLTYLFQLITKYQNIRDEEGWAFLAIDGEKDEEGNYLQPTAFARYFGYIDPEFQTREAFDEKGELLTDMIGWYVREKNQGTK